MKSATVRTVSCVAFLFALLLVEKSEGEKVSWLGLDQRAADDDVYNNDYTNIMDGDDNSDEELQLVGAYRILRNVLGNRWDARRRQAIKRGCAVFRGGIHACLKQYEKLGRLPGSQNS